MDIILVRFGLKCTDTDSVDMQIQTSAAQNRVPSRVLLVRKLYKGILHKCCTFRLWPKGNYCRAFGSSWLCDAFQKITQISHLMLSIPRLTVGSLRRKSWHSCTVPVSTAGWVCLWGRWKTNRRSPSLVSAAKSLHHIHFHFWTKHLTAGSQDGDFWCF